MPDDLSERLRAFVPPPSRASLAATDELPSTVKHPLASYYSDTPTETVPLVVRETERAARHDLQAVLRLIESGKVAVSDRTRRPGRSATRLVAAALEGGDFYAGGPADEGDAVGPVKAFAWPLVVQAAGLARPAGSRLALTKAGSKALDASPATTLRTAWTRWLDTPLLDELSRVDAIKGQNGKGKRGLTAVAGRRLALADTLAECPLGSWVETDELFRYMRAAGHEFEVTRDAWRLYICEPEYGSLGYDGCGGWNILQARYALCLLFEYAATLGLIDVAYVEPAGARPDFHELWGTDGLEFLSRYDGLLHIRLTSLGAFCVGLTDAYEPAPLEARAAFTLLPNLDVAATGDELTFAERLALDRYAEKTSDRVWRLRRDRLLAAVEGGESVAAVREFLSFRSDAPLPAAVVQMLEDVAERNGSSTRALCLAVGDRQLAVPAASERAFRRALRKLGYGLGARASGGSVGKAA